MFWLALCVNVLRAQHYVNYSVNEGLPSPEVHYVHEGIEGYLWFCTDRGVSRYDGNTFVNFTTDHGLSNNTVFKVFESPEGDLWFTCHDGSISIYQRAKQRFVPFWGNDELREIAGSYWVFAVGFRGGEIHLPLFRNIVPYEYMIVHQKDSSLEQRLFPQGFNRISYENLTIQACEKHIWGAYAYQIISSNGSGISLPSTVDGGREILHVAAFEDERIVCSTEGFVRIKTGEPDYKDLSKKYTCATKDREGNYWLTTVSDGVYKIPSFDIKFFPSNTLLSANDKFVSIGKYGEHLICGSNLGVLVGRSKNGAFKTLHTNSSDKVSVSFLVPIDDWLWSTGGTALKAVDQSASLKVFQSGWPSRYFIKKLKNGNYVSFGSPSTLEISSDPYGQNYLYRHPDLNVIALHETEEGHIYFSTFNDLYLLKNGAFDELLIIGDAYGLRGKTVRKITSFKSRLVFATSGSGVVLVQGDEFISVKEADGLASNLVNDVLISDDGNTIFCGTDKGISKVCLGVDHGKASIKSIINLDQGEGLASSFVLKIAEFDHKIWALTDQGICNFDVNFTLPTNPAPIVHITDLEVNGRRFGDSATFTYKENTVNINYIGISTKHPSNQSFYRYRILREQEPTNWTYTDNNSVLLTSLSPGDYTFLVSAQATNSGWAQPEQISFTITPYWLNRSIVQISIVVVLLMLAYWAYKNRISKLKLKQEKEMTLALLNSKVNELELAMLRGQMNPHFVYNALQSVQKFVLTDNKWSANKLITRFGKLMRSSLEYSRADFISIEQEINFLSNYFQIETQRFPDRFDHQITNALGEQGLSVSIPPLVIQPVCENAIKHSYREGLVHISVTFSIQSENAIRVEISDDGVGYLHSDEVTKPLKKSFGLDIVRNRITLFKEQGLEAEFKIRPFDKSTGRGTVVELTLPIK